ncbi:hypothetical protein Ancab_028985 [Ancistrocladus abbreviatus]
MDLGATYDKSVDVMVDCHHTVVSTFAAIVATTTELLCCSGASTQLKPRQREQEARHTSNLMRTHSREPEIEPLSGKPFIPLILSRSHVKPLYHLNVPARMVHQLPRAVVPVHVSRDGKSWMMTYDGAHRPRERLESGWREFVNDNELEAGDACIFELMECSSNVVKLKVQILRGNFPSVLLERVNGHSTETPIILDD